MKIPLRVAKIIPKQEAFSPILSITLREKRCRIVGMIDALVDTGAPSTHVSYRDATRLNILIKKLPSSYTRPITIAGCKFSSKAMKNVTFKLTKEDGSAYDMVLSELLVWEKPMKTLVKKEAAYKYIPSIIGTDFLEKYKFALYFNPSEKEAYLEMKYPKPL